MVSNMRKTSLSQTIWHFSVSKWILYLVVFFVPLYFSFSHWYPFTTPKTLLILASTLTASIFFVWGFVKNRQEKLFITPLHCLLLLFLFIMFIAGVLGVDPHTSFFGTFFSSVGIILLISLGLFSFLVSEYVRRDELFIRRLLFSSFISGVLVSFVSYLELTQIHWRIFHPSDIGGSTIGNSSFTGTFLLFVIGFGLYLALTAEGWKRKLVYLIGLFMMGFCPTLFNRDIWRGVVSLKDIFHSPVLLIGTAQGAFLGITIAILVSFCLWLSLSKRGVLNIMGTMLLLISLGACAISYRELLNPQSSVHNGFTKTKTATRFVFWDIAEEAIRERPLLGYGFENYQTIYQQHFDPIVFKPGYKNEEGVTNPHNIVYDMALSGGVLGLFSYLFLLAVTSWVFFDFAKNSENKEGRFMVIFSGTLIGYFIQNLFIFDLPTSYLFYFLCIGLAMGSLSLLKKGREIAFPGQDFAIRKTIGGIIVAVLVAGLILFVILPAKESWHWEHARNASLADRIDMIKNTEDISLMGGIDDIVRYSNDILNVVDNLRRQPSDDMQKKVMLDTLYATVDLLEKNINKHPDHFYSNYEAAMLLHLAFVLDLGHTQTLLDRARGHLDRAKAISPLNPMVYFNIAQNELFRNKIESAISFIHIGIALGAEKEGTAFLTRIHQ